MKGLMKWLKKMFKHLFKTLQFWKKHIEELDLDLAPEGEGRVAKRGLPKWRKYRVVRTSRGGINMPKRQSCPVCQSSSKRQEKTLNGASYRCSTHGRFFVRA